MSVYKKSRQNAASRIACCTTETADIRARKPTCRTIIETVERRSSAAKFGLRRSSSPADSWATEEFLPSTVLSAADTLAHDARACAGWRDISSTPKRKALRESDLVGPLVSARVLTVRRIPSVESDSEKPRPEAVMKWTGCVRLLISARVSMPASRIPLTRLSARSRTRAVTNRNSVGRAGYAALAAALFPQARSASSFSGEAATEPQRAVAMVAQFIVRVGDARTRRALRD
jgi:hypothetical protein